MSNLFGEPIPTVTTIRIHHNAVADSFNWDLLCVNADTLDILAMFVSAPTPMEKLGPELARSVLAARRVIVEGVLPGGHDPA